MLRRLEIENYGLIASAGVEFAPGATIFTGETGSGKTMLLGALDFALGRARAPTSSGAARVERPSRLRSIPTMRCARNSKPPASDWTPAKREASRAR